MSRMQRVLRRVVHDIPAVLLFLVVLVAFGLFTGLVER